MLKCGPSGTRCGLSMKRGAFKLTGKSLLSSVKNTEVLFSFSLFLQVNSVLRFPASLLKKRSLNKFLYVRIKVGGSFTCTANNRSFEVFSCPDIIHNNTCFKSPMFQMKLLNIYTRYMVAGRLFKCLLVAVWF